MNNVSKARASAYGLCMSCVLLGIAMRLQGMKLLYKNEL